MDTFEKLTVHTKTEEYPIYITTDFSALPTAFHNAGLTGRRVLVVADTNTSILFGTEIEQILAPVSAGVSVFVIAPGENSKSIDTARGIYARCIDLRLDRTSVIVALGGGVVGDLAGFIAATYMRGIAYIQIPTTLLAQVDSGVGGKTAVNFGGLKNIVGAFYQPRFVYSNISALGTLSRDDFLSGLAEAIKAGLIFDKDYLGFIATNKDRINTLDPEALSSLVHGACRIKAEVVLQDEREDNLREILNFGHTFGHGIESISEFAIPHGHAVAIGSMAALAISLDKGFISAADAEYVKNLYHYFGLPVSVSGYSAEDIYSHMTLDKKSRNGVLSIILLQRLGLAYSERALGTAEILSGVNAVIQGE